MTPTVKTEEERSHAKMKAAVGVKCANCETCKHLGSDGDGPEYNGSWPVCNKVDRYGYLRSFPFKKDMPCWEPDFWKSKFCQDMKTGTEAELGRLVKQYRKAVEEAQP